MSKDPVVIVGMARTPMGGLLGALKDATATDLGATAIAAAVSRAGIDAGDVDETIMGCVLSAGLGQAPARQASRKAGLPDDVGAVTINKMCGSGMKAMMQAHDSIMAGTNRIAVAGGMESMTNAPFLMKDARRGQKYGHTVVYDHMALDGLEDAYEPGRAMGVYAEQCVEKYQFTREEQDAYSLESLKRAQQAIKNGHFDDEVTPVTITTRRGETVVSVDEQPGNARPDKIPTLRPAFKKDGTVTAANASSISDGAAALVLMSRSEAESRNLPILAEIKAHAEHSQEPEWFTTAPVKAIAKVAAKAEWALEEVDLFEVNEAFAVVAMAAMRELGLSHDKVNVHGGACALGHPIGASGARIIVTLLAALKTHDKRKGIASLCIGGGEAVAIAIERMT